MKQTMWVAICAAAAMILIAGCGGGSTSTTAEAQGEAANTQGEAANGDTPTATTIPDGHWERDVDFKPGTYRAPGGQECEWAQADKLEGVEVGSGHTHYGRNLLVEVRDKYFRTEGCGVWTKQGAQSAGSPAEAEPEGESNAGVSTTISDGHWQSGTDFEPGLYRAPGGPECEWAQADSPNGIESGSGNTYYGVNLLVEIEGQYFRTEGCGVWRLAEGAPEGRDVPTATTIPDGHWRNGTDFQPGTYRAPGGGECEWAQGETARQVESGSGNTHYGRNLLAEITDQFFRTEGCGVWQKVS
jgi:hypothetical protein